MLSSFVRLHWQRQEPPGAFDTPPHLPGRESSLVRPPTIRAGGAENGGRHRPPVTRHVVRWLVPGYGAGAVIHERVPSETDLLDAACWLGVPLPRGWLSLMGTVGCQAEPGCIWNRASFSS